MSSYVRIGGAALLGGGIILGAFFVQKTHPAEALPDGAIVSEAPERQHIATTDTDKDGVEDWKDSLSAKIFGSINTPTSSLGMQTGAEYTPPTTFTGKFAEAFFADYMEGKTSGADLKNPEELIGNALAAIESNTQSKIYTSSDITVVPNSGQALHTYGNQIAQVIALDAGTGEDVLLIVKRALEKNNPQELEALVPIKNVLRTTLEQSRTISVPVALAEEHAALLSAYAAILMDLEAMELVFTDPLYAMARTKRYEDDAAGLYLSLKGIGSALAENGIAYEKEDLGSLFSSL